MITSKEKSDSRKIPMMPIRDVVIFPHMMTPFVVGRESSVRALEEALAGGGEGKAPVGMPGPKTPWGKPAMGYRTRGKKQSDRLIVRRRYES